MGESAKPRDEIGQEAPRPEPAATTTAGWTAVVEAAATRPGKARHHDGAITAPMLARLRAVGRSVTALLAERLPTGLPHWRAALGLAARTLHFPEIIAQSPASAPAPATAALAPPELLDPAQVHARVEAIMTLLPPRGDPTVPANLQAVGRLLADSPPTEDFEAADLLHDCFPRGTRNSDSRVLMAIARNLTRAFGRSGRLPITGGKAWTMIDPELFSEELAAQLAAISSFILHWQATEKAFLILEFAEVELIEYLFENLHPRRHAGLLIKVMDFKVLSLRRMGLLRRIPARVRRRIHAAHDADPAAQLAYIEDTMALLNHLTRPECFSAVAAAARAARGELEKIAAHLAGTGGPQPAAVAAPLHPVMRGLGSPPPPPAIIETAPPRQMMPPPPPPRRRFTKKQKTEAVMRLLQGEEREWVAISMGVSPQLLTRWQDAFLDGGSAALAQPAKGMAAKAGREPSVDDLKDKLHALIKTVEQLSSQMAQAPAALALPAPPAAEKPAKIPLTLPAPAKETRRRKTED